MAIQSKKKLRDSGILLGIVVFLLFCFLPFIVKGEISYLPLSLASFLILLSILSPYSLRSPLKYWIKFGNLAARINSTLILMIFFYLILLPASLIRYLIKKIRLSKKRPTKSYYIKDNPSISSNLTDQY